MVYYFIIVLLAVLALLAVIVQVGSPIPWNHKKKK